MIGSRFKKTCKKILQLQKCCGKLLIEKNHKRRGEKLNANEQNRSGCKRERERERERERAIIY